MASQNPFDALPTGTSDPAAPTGARVYSPAQVLGATFFGGVLAGSILIGLNHRSHGQSERAMWTVAAGVAGTAVLLGIGMMLPENFPSMGIPIGSMFAMRGYAQTLQAAGYGRDVREAPSGPLGVVVAVGIGCFVLMMIAVVALVLAAEAAGV
ncbi:hypothetical protein LBMAG42_05430 [Deltaproteobacteria bacterium]|nr:hypothetical protein LBMAG42_05430 [Deltaproteobacteria bacterium]